MLKFNTKSYLDACTHVISALNNMFFALTVEIDINECFFGIGGIFLQDPLHCKWKEYEVSNALYDGLTKYDKEFAWIPDICISDFFKK